MRLLVTLRPGESGYVIAECPALPGCMTQGRTEPEALANIREAIEGWIEVANAELDLPAGASIAEVAI